MEVYLTLFGMCDCCGSEGYTGDRHHHHHLPERGWIQFLLLLLINESPAHGYQLMEELEDRGFVRHGRFKTGSAYTILNRMEEHAYLTSNIEESEAGRERRVYSITDEGRERLKRGLEYMLKRKKLLDKLERYYNKHFTDTDTR
ncbi:MAG: PadR family transcriptional regulator [Candidatus Bathyarchaeia archaeon]